jgi:DNA/RNA-binding domain of Phe-tRNA-synthetase-like protein
LRRFVVDEEIFDRFSGLCLGVVTAEGVENQGMSPDILDLILGMQKEIEARFVSETLSEEPKIQAWRKAYSAFGAKPKKYKSSVESLYRMAIKSIPWNSINKIVDIYNYISLKNMLPLGGDDLGRVEGDIVLTFARGDESFTPLNSEVQESVKPGEVIYRDDRDVLCRRWNWRECDKTKMTENTCSALLVVEGLSPVTKEDVNGAVEELSELLTRFCGGRNQSFLLDSSSPSLNIEAEDVQD